jgi:AcrR family transcriptional regulator
VTKPALDDDDRPRRRRDKLSPDPAVRNSIVAAAVEIAREQGVRALNVASVLQRCRLGTRAFYRHFASKDELVAALFLEAARAETRRLRRRMRRSPTPVDAVAAWIDGRLDLAFDANIKSELRQLSVEAQSLMFASPPLVLAAFNEMLAPLVEELNRGLNDGLFNDIDPQTSAQIIQGAVWACIEREWVGGHGDPGAVRRHLVQTCLRGLGVAPKSVAAVLAARSYSSPKSGRTQAADRQHG